MIPEIIHRINTLAANSDLIQEEKILFIHHLSSLNNAQALRAVTHLEHNHSLITPTVQFIKDLQGKTSEAIPEMIEKVMNSTQEA